MNQLFSAPSQIGKVQALCQTQPLRVYLAGKIAPGVPWRSEALRDFTIKGVHAPGGEDGAKNCWFSFRDIADALNPNAVMHAIGANGALDVIGPFFVGWDHVDAPCGEGLHAVVDCGDEGARLKPAKIHEIHKRVHQVNLGRIRRADLVFAHIDEADCFGTISEIGFAHGVGTPVHLHFGSSLSREQRDDMWFVAGFASSIHEDISVKTAFKCVLQWWRRRAP